MKWLAVGALVLVGTVVAAQAQFVALPIPMFHSGGGASCGNIVIQASPNIVLQATPNVVVTC